MATINTWKRFIDLLPGGTRLIGEVVTVNLDAGTSRVRLRGGSEIVVRGTHVPVEAMAFIVDDIISGPVPSLPQFDIEV